MPKIRCDAPLKNLPQDRQDQIIEWCLTPKAEDCPGGYQHAREQLAADGLKVSLRALSDFFSWHQLKEFYEGAEAHAEEQKQLMAEFDPANTERAEKFGDFCFIQQATKTRDVKAYVAVGQLRETRKMRELREKTEPKKLELIERRVHLLETNAAAAKEKLTAVAAKGGLSAETLRQIEEAAGLL